MSEIAFLGLDTETTGLDPVNDHLLEIAVVAFNRNLRPLASFGAFFATPETEEIIATRGEGLHEIPREMHEKTGLWDEIQAYRADQGLTPLGDYDTLLTGGIDEWFEMLGTPERKLPILGNSSHFDRRFLETRLPNLLGKFSHRHIDPSGLLETMKGADFARATVIEAEFETSIEHEQFEEEVSLQQQHRAHYDVHRSAALLRYLWRVVDFASFFPLYTHPNVKES